MEKSGRSLLEYIKETIRHGLVYGFGSILYNIVGFVLIPVYTRYLSPSDYGIFSLLLITSWVAIAIFQMGLNSAVLRSYYDYDEVPARKRVISTAFYILLGNVFILAVLGAVLSPFISNLIFQGTKYAGYFRLVFFTACFTIVSSLPLVLFRARKQSKKYTIYNISFFILRIILIVYFVVMAKKGVKGVILANFLASAIYMGFLLVAMRKDIVFNFSRIESVKMLAFGFPLIFQVLSRTIVISSDSYFLKVFSTTADVGLYNLGYTFGNIAHVLLFIPLAMVWNPMILSVKDEDFAAEYYSKALTYFMYIGAFLVLGIALLSKDVIHVMADRSFWSAYRVVPLILVSYLFFGSQRILNTGIILKRKTKYSAIIFVFTALLNLVLNFLLIPRYGMMGAAWATVMSFFFMNVMKYPVARRCYKVDYEWTRIIKIAICGIIVFFIGIHVNTDNIGFSVILKVLLTLLFPLLLVIFGFYDKDERKVIGDLSKKYLLFWKRRV